MQYSGHSRFFREEAHQLLLYMFCGGSLQSFDAVEFAVLWVMCDEASVLLMDPTELAFPYN